MKTAYKTLQKLLSKQGFGRESHVLIGEMFSAAGNELTKCQRLPLISMVEGKSYFSFESPSGLRSRPVNIELFEPKPEISFRVFQDILEGNRHQWKAADITKSLYSVALTCCAAIDVLSASDRKTQGTIFEWLCAAVMQATLKVVPARSLVVLNLDLKGNLPTDFVFDLGSEKPKFHLPVKTSTRERIIQVWAHQRVLDGVYGVGRFLAMPMILTETKLDTKKLEVTEICLPWQWRLYQMHIANLWNVCYLDAPEAYLKLDSVFPRVGVVTIGEMLASGGRLDELLRAHGLSD